MNWGGMATFTCQVSADPDATIIWMRDDQEIQMNDTKYKVMDDGSLMIKNLEDNDNGYYECMVKSPEGVVKSRPARMVVRSITVDDENG